ncbi:MotA/TolQ/ExbB proton channel family protein [Pseudacidovorax intermedius]|uniref:Biopolymer transport protein ExbB n=1 Tax=Pseudacidovorax intermedius TaxID=433924 RepID=A0A147GZ26_9BURK|nr:MotA/TolQ/ExbB proton channel family protein [Pseudacidovorax intermedius]KTT22841.1 flagellar motor protein MotA [Pseudacidovorax intermedius]
MGALSLLTQADAVGRMVALLLLAMSVASWVTLLWKAWALRGGAGGIARAVAAFWQSPDVGEGVARMAGADPRRHALPLAQALQTLPARTLPDTLQALGQPQAPLTRALRDALQAVLRRLQAGQILLATIGATAPFVGLLGTVWGIHGALVSIAGQAGGFTIDKVAGPVGEALIMTAFGLAVALPAVAAYNVFGRRIGHMEAELEGFAHDLLAVFAPEAPASLPPARPMPVTA